MVSCTVLFWVGVAVLVVGVLGLGYSCWRWFAPYSLRSFEDALMTRYGP